MTVAPIADASEPQTAMRRADGPAKVRGRAQYSADYAEVGMLHGAVLRSPVPAGRITRLDVGAAESAEGVVAVCTAADQPATRAGWVLQDQTTLAIDEVRYEGEPIAVVVAATRAQAITARDEIVLEIEEFEPLDLQRSAQDGARVIHPDWADYVPSMGEYPREGNLAAIMTSEPDGVDEAFAAAARIVESTYTADRQYQAYLEPKAATVSHDDGKFVVHTAVQYPFNVRDRVAQLMGVRLTDVRVIGETIGGGFGAKLDAAVEPLAALAAKVTGRTVSIRNSRQEDLLTCPCRENAVVTMRTALDENGAMIARDVVVDMDNGAYSGEMPWLASLPLHIASATYRVEGPTRVIARLWYTNTAPTGAFRGVGGAYLYSALEQHTDAIANELGEDRRAFRVDRLIDDGTPSLSGQVLEDAGILRVAFDELEQVAPWDELLADVGPNQGIGLAAGVWMTNPMPGQATVRVNEDGTVQVITAATENGSGAVALGITRIVAEELGVDPADVSVTMPDTAVSGYDAGSQGSRTTHVVGRAALDAARDAKAQLLEAAAELLEAGPGDLVVANGVISVAGTPTVSVPVAEAAAAALWSTGPISASGSYATPPIPYNDACGVGVMFTAMATPTYHVHLAVVEVDPVSGRVDVVRYIVIQEVGKTIDEVGLRGQIQGAVTQGIGYALTENLRIGDDCRYLERSLEAYRLPLAVDTPTVEYRLLEHPDEAGPFGAKGAAEPPLVFVAGAISNAVAHALGRPINHLPITPEAVMDVLDGSA